MAADSRPELFPLVPEAEVQRRLRLSKRLLVQRCRRIALRCLDMTPGEVVHRVGAMFAPRAAAPVTTNVSDSGTSVAAVADALRRRFVVGAEGGKAALDALVALPDARARLLAEAGRLEREGAWIFGRLIPLDPHGVDWQADPCSGKRLWSERTGSEGDAVQATRSSDGTGLTDVKYVWELNRHQFLITLAVAAHVTSDPALIGRASALVDGWIDQNPPGRGVNWSSVLEVGVRAIAWLWTLPLVIDSPALAPDRARRWIASLRDHYEALRTRLSIYTDRSNHLIGESAALWMLASVLPDLPDADLEAARALEVLAVEIERQVTADGVTREQAAGYHCFVLDFYLQVLMVARHQRITLPPIIESRVGAMLGFLRRLLGAGGALPSIGDADDGLGMPAPFPLSARERAEALLAAGTRLLAFRESPAACSLVALLTGTRDVADAEAAPPDDAGSELFADGGYGFLEATDAAGNRHQMIFDVGGLGYLPNAAHEHADALSILVRVNGTLVLADPGTGTYTACRTVRDGFRGTASHNTVTIDDLDQADVLDTFKWINCFRTRVLRADFGQQVDHLAAVHEGFERMRDRMRHGREVLFVRPDYWLVVDHVFGRGQHTVARRFHFPPDVVLEPRGPATFDATAPDAPDGLRLVVPDTSARATVAATERGPWSSGYGRWETSARLVLRDQVDATGVFLTLITPLHRGQAGVTVSLPEPTAPGANHRDDEVVCRMRVRGSAMDREDVIVRSASGALTFVSRTGGSELVRTLGDAFRK